MRIHRLIPTFLLSTVAVLPAAAGQYDICLSAADSVTCIIEQAEFARQRNNEIDASIAAVARSRAFEQARNAEIAASIAAVAATRTRQLEIEQNALPPACLPLPTPNAIAASPPIKNALAHGFDEATRVQQNASQVGSRRDRAKTHCHSPQSRTPRCQAERAQKLPSARTPSPRLRCSA